MKRSLPFHLAVVVGCVLIPVLAQAQSLNIDLGFVGSAPAANFGAAAGQIGTWNDILALAVNNPLVDLNGVAVAASINYVGQGNGRAFDDPATNGADEALMDDILDIGPQGNAGQYVIGPLGAGAYRVYVYAMSPDDNTDRTLVAIHGGAQGGQQCGGAFAGYVAGVTHVTDVTVVPANGSITIDVSSFAGNGSVNGIQLVKDPADLKLGKNFNIDIGLIPNNHPRPAAAYGAAAGRVGFWNVFGGGGPGDNPLADLAGVGTDARVSQTGGATFTQANDPATNGNDEALLDDYQDIGPQGRTATWTIGPMAKGTYDVYVYAWDPAVNGNTTAVKVQGGKAAAPQVCGGAAFAGFVLGNTHVVEQVVLAANGKINIDVTSNQGNGAINGIQIVAAPLVVRAWNHRPADNGDNAAEALTWSLLGLLDGNGYPGTVGADGTITDPGGNTLGIELRAANNAAIGVRSANGQSEAYDISSGFTLDQVWQRVGDPGTFDIITHGFFRPARGAVPRQNGGGFQADNRAAADGYTNVALGAGTGAGYGAAYRLTNRNGATIAMDLNNCYSKNDPDGAGPITSVVASTGVVVGVGNVRGHIGPSQIATTLDFVGGTNAQRRAAITNLQNAALAAGFRNPDRTPDVMSWVCSLLFRSRHTTVINTIANGAVVPTFAYSLVAPPAEPAHIASPARTSTSPDALTKIVEIGLTASMEPTPAGTSEFDAYDLSQPDTPAYVLVDATDVPARTFLEINQVPGLPVPPPTSQPYLVSGVFDFRYNGVEPSLSGPLRYGLRVPALLPSATPSVYFLDGSSWVALPSNANGQYLTADLQRVGIFAAFSSAPVGVVGGNRPVDIRLRSDPNPFNGTTRIHFDLTRREFVELSVFDLGGRLIKRIYQGAAESGPFTASWNGTDSEARKVPQGVYVLRLSIAGGASQTRRIVLLN